MSHRKACAFMAALVGQFLETFKEFPPTCGDSLSVDAVLAQMQSAQSRQ
jgi:hypothetical protein